MDQINLSMIQKRGLIRKKEKKKKTIITTV